MTAFQQFVRTLCAAIFACLYYLYASSPEAGWIVLTALLLVQISPNNFFWRDVISVLICGAFIANNVFWVNELSQNYITLACVLFLLVFFCVFISLMNSELFVPATLVSLLTLVSLGMTANSTVSPDELFLRIKYILVGSLIAALMKILFWPPGLRRHLCLQIANCLQVLNQLQKLLFWIYIARNYAEKHYFYEKELHSQRLRVLNCIDNIRLLSKSRSTKKTIQQLEKLFEITIALGEMRYRVKDFSTFEMSENEFVAISNSLANLLDQAVNKILFTQTQELDCSRFNSAIEALADLVGGALQVAAAEPVVYVIFMEYLRVMGDELKLLLTNVSGETS